MSFSGGLSNVWENNTPTEEEAQQAAAIRRLRYQAYKPSRELPADCNPIKLENPHLAYWGIGFMARELTAYAKKHLQFEFKDRDDPWGLGLMDAWERAVEHLSEKLDYKLKLRSPISPDYWLVIGLYSNINLWDLDYDGLYPEDEELLLRQIQEELGVTFPPQWHYDSHVHARRRVPWRLFSEEELEEFKEAARADGTTKMARLTKVAILDDAAAATEPATGELNV